MAREKEFRVLVATDGSRQAQAAIATAVHFPWPARTRVRAVIARRTRKAYTRSILLTAIDRGAAVAGNSARRTLSRRWPDVEIEVVDKAPVAGILEEAEHFHADVIVVGWRGHGSG
jgi:nucleotide-binding universal stress UspA family protein